MADTILDIEKKVKNIHKHRREVDRLNKEISKLRDDISSYMKKEKKHMLKVGDFSVLIKYRDKNFADFEILKKLIEQGVIPPETMKTSRIEIVQVSSKADFILQGNKFVKK